MGKLRAIKDIGELFSCKNITNFINSIRYVLPYRGYSESKFFICEYRGVEFLIKLSFYKKTDPEIYHQTKDSVNPVDAEIDVLDALKTEIINKNITPCILELLCYKKCNSIREVAQSQEKCDDYVTNPPKNANIHDIINMFFCKQMELYNNGLSHEKFSFIVLEECDVTLHDYLVHFVDTPVDMEVLISLIFQIIYTIYAISRVFPRFRHRDLHSNNVMLKLDNSYKFSLENPKYIVMYVDGERYTIPYFGIICKIIDFGFASIPEKGIISEIVNDKYMMHLRTDNDLLYFFSDVYAVSPNQPMINSILEQLEPNKSYIHFNTDFIARHADKFPTVKQMVGAKLFDKYRGKDPKPSEIWHEYRKNY